MKLLLKRLGELNAEGTPYELDYLTMKSGFVYRHCAVLSFDEETLMVTQETFPETALNISEIASARIILM
ncbi:MAG: hypothetical protein EOQ89_03645 [Mesorhizobium sp.]|nr:MAG: hypothetical protein EOQ89_03645 [Mesorhizobium sp.]